MPQPSPRSPSKGVSDLNRIQTLFDKGEFRKVLFQAQGALKSRPDHVGLHALAGISARRLGEAETADQLFSKAVALEIDRTDGSLELPQVLMQEGRFQMALPLFAALVQKTPTDAAALNGLGLCLLEVGEIGKALLLLGDAVKHGPQVPQYAIDLGRAFEESRQEVLALECYAIAQQLSPKNEDYVLKSVKLMYILGKLKEALALLEKCIASGSQSAAVLSNYASLLSALGRNKEASDVARATIELYPTYSNVYANLAARQNLEEFPGFEELVDAQLKRKLSKTDEIHFRMAKVTACEERGDFESAYHNLCIANSIKFEKSGFDIEAEERLFDLIKKQFSEQPDLKPRDLGCGPTPIFVLGMPRSGTSLTEAILGRHSRVKQRGEVEYLASMVKQLGLLDGPLTAEQAQQLRETYMSRLEQLGSLPFITDKMPQNFRLIGHIVTAMPDARIVHVKRDPRAVCWSNFRHFFTGGGLGFSCNTDSLVRYFDLYVDIMTFWNEKFSDRIINLDYEALVADPHGQIRYLIQALGLEWEEACLSPEDSAHVTRTASQAQVRKKIYKGSSQGWLKYEPWAGEWLSAVSPR